MDYQRVHMIAALIQQQNYNLFRLYRVLDRRRMEFGLYDQLMVELRNEDPCAFHHFMRMPPAMFDELVERLRPRLTEPSTNFRPNMDPGLQVALTLRQLASSIWNHIQKDTVCMKGGIQQHQQNRQRSGRGHR